MDCATRKFIVLAEYQYWLKFYFSLCLMRKVLGFYISNSIV